jgi:hypothetical protein
VIAVVLTASALAAAPLDPDAPEARRLILDELAKPEYQQAQPNWLDQLASAFLEWFQSIQVSGTGGPSSSAMIVVVVAVLLVAIVAFLVFGLPRLDRRSRVTGSLFGEDDDRTAAAMRRDAAQAAASGDYTLAIAELFRAIARDLAERTVLTVSPGTTARDFAGRAGRAFPASADQLGDAAVAFDDVRYLDRVGTADEYERLVTLDRALRDTRPVFDEAGV